MRLTLRTKKIAMTATTVGCLAASVGVATWGLYAPDQMPADHAMSQTPHGKRVAASSDDPFPVPARDAFAKLVDRPLRRPLYDPPPPKPVVKQLPPLRVELLGTILEGENSVAIIRTEQGKTEYRKKGDTIGPADSPAQVVEIQGDAVELERAETRITLRVQTARRK